MSVYFVERVLDESGSIDRQNVREYSEQYVARTDPDDSVVTVRTDSRVPKPWQPHRDDPRAFCTKVTPTKRAGTDDLWDIEVQYTTEIEERADPLARPPRIWGEFAELTRLAEIDAEGKPALNTAGDLLEGLEVDDARLVLNVEKNLAALPRWILSYNNAVNADAVRILGLDFPEGTLKLKNLRFGDLETENEISYRVLSFQLHHRQEGWETVALNRGFQELVRRQKRVDGELVTVTEKVPIRRL